MKNHTPCDPGELRSRAEAKACSAEPAPPSARSPEEFEQMLHELRVHQIELEMQNEELRTAQELIQAGRARYFDLYDLAPVGYCTLSEHGLILEANLTAATLLGTARSALVQRPFSGFIFKEDQDCFYLQHTKLMATGAAQECELRLARPDGAFFWAHVTAIAAQSDNGAPVARMTFNDISERMRLNDQLELRVADRTRELTMLNQELEAFAYSVSHDLRAPLRSIHGFASLLEEEVAEGLSAEGRSHLLRIQDSAKRMGQLISDLLSMAQLGRTNLRHEPVNLSGMARAIASEFDRSDPQRRVTWHLQDGLQVQADPGLMRVVLQNLLGNAWKYTGLAPDAHVSLTQTRGEHGMLEFCVRDNGAGFDMTYAQQLFQPFKRLHAHHEFEGTGVGLATVHRVIQRHGGSVRGEGAVGLGAAFYFTVPVQPVEPVQPATTTVGYV